MTKPTITPVERIDEPYLTACQPALDEHNIGRQFG